MSLPGKIQPKLIISLSLLRTRSNSVSPIPTSSLTPSTSTTTRNRRIPVRARVSTWPLGAQATGRGARAAVIRQEAVLQARTTIPTQTLTEGEITIITTATINEGLSATRRQAPRPTGAARACRDSSTPKITYLLNTSVIQIARIKFI